MTFEIKYDKLVGVDYQESPNHSGTIKPVGIVNHYTAGYSGESAINTFLNRSSKVSAHLVIDRDGTVTQMVPFNKKAWHAGPSRYQGWRNLNGFFIGVEFVNIGYLRKTNKGYEDPYGRAYDLDKYDQTVIAEAEPRIGAGTFYWPSYSVAQIEAGLAVEQAIIDKYDIQAIVTHEEIDTRGWKTDPGPNFPQRRFKLLLDTRQDGEEEPIIGAFRVTASTLNVRSGPGVQNEKFYELKRDTAVVVNEFVGDWAYITFEQGRNGWVASRYLSR